MTDPRADEGKADTPIATGRFLSLVSRNGWEFATRVNARGVVAVVATTEANELVLVEQFRPPVGRAVIEIPAGLVGDDPRAGDEGEVEAARRELLEETGYVAREMIPAGRFVSSAGLSDETVGFYLARSVRRESTGGGVGGERITVHCVPMNVVRSWLRDAVANGLGVDAKVLTGLELLRETP